VRPVRITKKRIIVNTCALEEFLQEFNEDMVDSIETVWQYAYDTKEAAEQARGKADDEGFDEDDEVGNALIDLEYVMEYLRDSFPNTRTRPTATGRRRRS
jgi:hypothetical protein